MKNWREQKREDAQGPYADKHEILVFSWLIGLPVFLSYFKTGPDWPHFLGGIVCMLFIGAISWAIGRAILSAFSKKAKWERLIYELLFLGALTAVAIRFP